MAAQVHHFSMANLRPPLFYGKFAISSLSLCGGLDLSQLICHIMTRGRRFWAAISWQEAGFFFGWGGQKNSGGLELPYHDLSWASQSWYGSSSPPLFFCPPHPKKNPPPLRPHPPRSSSLSFLYYSKSYSRLQIGWPFFLKWCLQTFNWVPGEPGFPWDLSLVPCHYLVLIVNSVGRIQVRWKNSPPYMISRHTSICNESWDRS